MRCCVEDGGLLALRIRPAEGGSKPPAAALAEDCRGERCRKRRTGCVRWGPGRRPLLRCRYLTSGGIKTVGFLCSRDEPGGCALTGQVGPGIEAEGTRPAGFPPDVGGRATHQ